MAETTRKAQLNLVVGINGTGKTTFLQRNVVEKSRKSLVITPDEMEWRQLPEVTTPTEIYNLQQPSRLIYHGPESVEMAIRNFYGGALILDDARSYIGAMTSDTLNYLYIRRRQRGVDVYIVAHGMRQVPVQCFTYMSYLILFLTTENISDRRRDLDPELYAKILAAKEELKQRRVKEHDPYVYKIIKMDYAL